MTMEGISRVRYAEPGDEDEIMSMCADLHSENGLFPMAADKVRSVIRRHFNREGGIIGVVGETGQLEGSICMTVDQFWYSDAWFLCERWNYVRPEFRKSTNAKDLIKFGTQAPAIMNMPLVIGVMSNDRTAAKVELYKRVLGPPAGAYWVCNSDFAHLG